MSPPRPAVFPEDFPAMMAMISRAWIAHGPAVTLHVGDLVWRACRQRYDGFYLWHTSSGQLAALLQFNRSDGCCDLCLDPAWRHPDLMTVVFDFAQRLVTEQTRGSSLTVGCMEGDQVLEHWLTTHGYMRRDVPYLHLMRRLDTDVTESPLPEGYRIRPFSVVTDLAGRIDLGRRVFGATSLTPGCYRQMAGGPGYDAALDLVAVLDSGEVVGFCTAWYDPAARAGELEPLGCHPDHRRRGLARALVAHALGRMRDRGAQQVVVYTGQGRDEARAFYASCGFGLAARQHDYQRMLRDDT